jgi:hypothetical protein
MRIIRTGSSLVPTFALTLTILSPLVLSAQTAGQDVHNAGRGYKDAAKHTGHAAKNVTEKIVTKSKEGTTVAADKTKETPVRVYDRSKEGAQKMVHSDAQRERHMPRIGRERPQ